MSRFRHSQTDPDRPKHRTGDRWPDDGSVGYVLDKPSGPLLLADDGKWWINRESLGVEPCGRLTITVADGVATADLRGTPEMLRRLAEAIVAQVEGAEANTQAEVV